MIVYFLLERKSIIYSWKEKYLLLINYNLMIKVRYKKTKNDKMLVKINK